MATLQDGGDLDCEVKGGEGGGRGVSVGHEADDIETGVGLC
jgi:hypothetical protein